MVDTFIYLKAGTLLNDKFKEKKQKNPAFSLRAWAMQLGLNSHGSLQQILAGKRTVPKKYLSKISSSLNFTVAEAMYFETLVDFEKSSNPEQKEMYYQRLIHLRPKKQKVQFVEVENYKFLQNPLHSIIRTMIDRKDFKNDSEWIQKRLRQKTTRREIEEVIERLIALGFVAETNGKLKKNQKHLKNKVDVPSRAVQDYHKQVSLRASEEVYRQSVDEKEFNSFCFNIQPKKMKMAKERIRNFIDDFIDEFEAPAKKSNETYQLNLQLYSLTKED